MFLVCDVHDKLVEATRRAFIANMLVGYDVILKRQCWVL